MIEVQPSARCAAARAGAVPLHHEGEDSHVNTRTHALWVHTTVPTPPGPPPPLSPAERAHTRRRAVLRDTGGGGWT